MSYPNSGVSAFEFSNLYSVTPSHIRDLFEALIDRSPYKRRIIWRYKNRGFDAITGEPNPELKEPCSCFNDNWGQGGRSGLQKCPACNGAGVKGGWVDEPIDCFFWNQIPPGLQKFSKLFTVPLPINRATVIVYVKKSERVRNGEFFITRIEDSEGGMDEVEYQAMNVRPVMVGEDIIWKWVQCQRQAVDVTTDTRASM